MIKFRFMRLKLLLCLLKILCVPNVVNATIAESELPSVEHLSIEVSTEATEIEVDDNNTIESEIFEEINEFTIDVDILDETTYLEVNESIDLEENELSSENG